MEVEEWGEQVTAKHPLAYGYHDPDTCPQVDLLAYPLETGFGDVLRVYNKDGFRIIRQKIVSNMHAGGVITSFACRTNLIDHDLRDDHQGQ